MAETTKSKRPMSTAEAYTHFRTLGTKSARADLRGRQPQTASDLDGLGTKPPVYQIGPDEPDDPKDPKRIYDAVDPAVAEFDKQRAERDEKRRKIGAKMEPFSEAMARAQVQIKSRKQKEQQSQGTLDNLDSSSSSDVLPEPPQPKGGLTRTEPLSTDERVRAQFMGYKDEYEKRGLSGNVYADGRQKTFRDFIGDIAEADPESDFAKAYRGGQGVFSAPATVYQDRMTQEAAKRTDLWNNEQERRRAMRQMATQGPAMVLQLADQQKKASETLQAKMADGRALAPDYLAFASLSNQMAGAYAAMERMYPGQGFAGMAQNQLLMAAKYASLGSSGQENMQTNQATVEIARMSGGSGGQEPTAAATISKEMDEARRSPYVDPIVRNMAITNLVNSGQQVNDANVNSQLAQLNTTRYIADLADAIKSPDFRPDMIGPGTPFALKVTELTQRMTEPEFIAALSPAVTNRTPQDTYRFLQKIYQTYRRPNPGLWGGAKRAAARAYTNIVGE